MTKGDTVQVTKGKSAGTTGTIFWVGETQYGSRVGIETDTGAKVWAKPDQVKPVVPTLTVSPGAQAAVEQIAAQAAFGRAAEAQAPAPSLGAIAAAMTAASEIDGLRARIILLEAAVAKLLEASAGAPAPADE